MGISGEFFEIDKCVELVFGIKAMLGYGCIMLKVFGLALPKTPEFAV